MAKETKKKKSKPIYFEILLSFFDLKHFLWIDFSFHINSLKVRRLKLKLISKSYINFGIHDRKESEGERETQLSLTGTRLTR